MSWWFVAYLAVCAVAVATTQVLHERAARRRCRRDEIAPARMRAGEFEVKT